MSHACRLGASRTQSAGAWGTGCEVQSASLPRQAIAGRSYEGRTLHPRDSDGKGGSRGGVTANRTGPVSLLCNWEGMSHLCAGMACHTCVQLGEYATLVCNRESLSHLCATGRTRQRPVQWGRPSTLCLLMACYLRYWSLSPKSGTSIWRITHNHLCRSYTDVMCVTPLADPKRVARAAGC